LASEAKIQFWLVRELCWWWTVSVMLAVLGDLVSESPIVLHFRRVIRRVYYGLARADHCLHA